MSKTAFITGASSGIGAATARALAELGYDLVITGRRTDRLQALNDRLEKEFGVKALVLGFDVRDRFQTESAIDALPGHFRTIDVLVNNAGLASGFEHIDEGDPMDWDKMIDTNVKGLLYVTRAVSRMMIENGQGGHIVNIGSIAGTQPYENGAVYCASKHAVHALSQGIRMDLLSHGIKVTEIRPGMSTPSSRPSDSTATATGREVYRGIEPLTGDDLRADRRVDRLAPGPCQHQRHRSHAGPAGQRLPDLPQTRRGKAIRDGLAAFIKKLNK